MNADDLRKKAIESLLNEAEKRRTLSEKMGAEAYYTRYCPAKADTNFLNRQLQSVNGHNKRWEQEKCWTIKNNLDKLDREKRHKRHHSTSTEDKYKDEKEYWRVQKALKFSNENNDISKKDVVDSLQVDRNNMLLFPTITSCESSEEETKSKEEEQQHRQHRQHKHHRHHKHHKHHTQHKHHTHHHHHSKESDEN